MIIWRKCTNLFTYPCCDVDITLGITASVPFAAALAFNACGDSTSPSPSAQSSNGITVISPNGGESFQVGGAIHVKWAVANQNFTSPDIQIGCAASDWLELTTGNMPATTTDTSFIIPDSTYSNLQKKKIAFPVGSTCKVRIHDYQTTTILDTSDAPFTVTPR